MEEIIAEWMQEETEEMDLMNQAAPKTW